MKGQKQNQRRQRPGKKKAGWLKPGLTMVLLLALLAFFFLGPRFFFKQDTPAGEEENEVEFYGRGDIYDSNGEPLALSYKTTAMYVKPLEIQAPGVEVDQLAQILELDKGELRSALKSERSFVWLGRDLEAARAEKIAALNIKGIYLVDQMNRYYPHGPKAAHVMGFVNDAQGLEGIEFHYNSILRGGAIPKQDLLLLESIIQDKLGPWQNALGESGADLFLSLDLQIQTLVEQHLDELMAETGAATATAALLAPDSGAVLALANMPAFDPNRFWDYDEKARHNRVVSETIRPGALLRLFRQAALFELYGDPETSAAPVLPTVEATAPATALDLKILAMFAEQLGFNRKCEIDLPVTGLAENDKGPASDGASFLLDDSTSTTTALQLLTAFSTLINGGRKIRPHLLAAVRSRDTGRDFKTSYPPEAGQSTQQIIKPSTSRAILDLIDKTGRPGPADAVFLESMPADEHLDQSGSAATAADAAGVPAAVEKIVAAGPVYDVMLGAAPRQDPELALIVVLDHGRPSAEQASPLVSMGRRLMPQLLKVVREPATSENRPFPEKKHLENYYVKIGAMARQNSGQSGKENNNRPATRMPDIKGKSLRRGLQSLQALNLRLQVVGAGRIVAQQPAAGALLQGNEVCVLQLE